MGSKRRKQDILKSNSLTRLTLR